MKLTDSSAKQVVSGAANTGEKTSDLRQLDDNALNSPELLGSVEERLANLRDLTGGDRGDRGNPAAEPEEEEPVTDESSDGEVAHEEPAKDDDSDQSDDSGASTLDGEQGAKKDGGKEKEEQPQLPDAYVRAALAYGWKEDEVKAEFQENPERTLKTLSNIYQTRNQTTREFAAIGRRQREVEAEEKKATERQKFVPVDTKALKEEYGDGPLIAMIEAQNKVLEQLVNTSEKAGEGARPKTHSGQAFASAADESHVEQQIHSFFESDRMKPYEKIYGRLNMGQTFRDLTPSQQEFRWKVMTEADAVNRGAMLQGVRMTLDEVLERGHLWVTQQYRDQVLVDGIKSKVVQRSKAISLKPSKGTRLPGGDNAETAKPGSRTREQLMSDTQRKLNRLFGDH